MVFPKETKCVFEAQCPKEMGTGAVLPLENDLFFN
jgi:hypothetical protein